MTPLTYPPATPAEIVDGFTLVKSWDSTALVSCRECGCELGVHLDKAGVVDGRYVKALAAHLFTCHNANQLVRVARGEPGCNFCRHVRTCTTPGDVNCRERR